LLQGADSLLLARHLLVVRDPLAEQLIGPLAPRQFLRSQLRNLFFAIVLVLLE
jgi:hypothetical protein